LYLLFPVTNRQQTMKELIAIFIGSGLGGLTRFGLSKWINGLHNLHFL